MDKELLEYKIKALEDELNIYRKKEEYTKAGLERTKNVYEVARKNAEIIISKTVNLAFDFKQRIEKTLIQIHKDPGNFEFIVKNFLKENMYFINQKDEHIKELVEKIINKIEK